MRGRLARTLAVAGLVACLDFAQPASGQALVGDPFLSSYTGWVDAFPPPTRAGNWRLSLHNPTLMDTNNANPPTTGAVTNSGSYEPDVLVQDNFLAPATYDLTARMRTNDDDIIGLVWNYQDPNNYFRVGIRTQAAGSFGGTQGLAVQKIVGGVLTQISPAGTGVGAATPITQAMINGRTPFDLKVAVDGTNYQVQFNGTPIVSGTDPDLATGRKVGVQSWAQLSDTDETPDPPFWGTEVESIAVTQGPAALYSETFDRRPIPWRQLVMTNATGTVNTGNTASKDDLGNFGRAINDAWIHQPSNGFENATVNNTDFIGPAVVVDEPGSVSLGDYQMKVRIGATDNDGLGVLVRVQDDNNFYRVNFTNEAIGAGVTRAPRGLSVQKVRNGVWTELFRDSQDAPLFVYTPATAGATPATAGFPMFDLSVQAVGNTLDIQIVDHLGNVIDYPLIVDNDNPLLNGTVGLTTWGTENVYYMNYSGTPGPLVTAVPEPAVVGLALAALLALRRRRR
jgi:MYXO-CTERM domain-containing protein